MAKASKPAPSDLFSDTNYTELFVEFSLIRCSSRTPQIQQTIPLSEDVKRCIVLVDAGHISQPYTKLFLIQGLKMLPRLRCCLKPFHATAMRALVALTKPPDSPIMSPKYWKNWHSFGCVFTDMYLSEIQTVSWGTFIFIILVSKLAFFVQCSFNSWAAFMNPEVAGLAKYWV